MRVLIADDNADAALSLATLMELAGHEVRVAHDGQAALDVAEGWSPQVVILDIDMPVMDGLQAAKQFRLRTPNVMLVALSGLPDWRVRPFLLEAGFDLYFEKLISFHDLRTAIDCAPENP